MRALLNFFNFLDGEEVIEITRFRRYVKIKQSRIYEVYISDDELKEAYKACPDNLKPIFRLLMYSGSRFSQLYSVITSSIQGRSFVQVQWVTSLHPNSRKEIKERFIIFSFIPPVSIRRFTMCRLCREIYPLQEGFNENIRKWHLNIKISHGVLESI
jgi:intergrase/recombinase